MKLFTSLFLFVLTVQLSAQEIVEVNYLGYTSQQELAIDPTLGLFLKNGVDSYEVIYTTVDLEGNEVNVSGLMVIPDDLSKGYPMLAYGHGTSGGPDDVPSDPNNGNAIITRIWGGLGYVAIAPDLLGLGVHEGVHPFVHADSEAWVTADMFRAVRAYCEENDVFINDQVFLTGYSQGGHISMATHREMQENLSSEFSVTAASHQSGPYDISGVMRDLLFIEEDYGFVAYLPNTALGYEEAYGTLYDELSDIFKAEYVSLVEQFANDEIDLFTLNQTLIDLLVQNEGVAAPGKLFKDDLIQELQDNPDHPINVALRDNDVYDWAPTSPTQILYCEADDQVPFMNSTVAAAKMQDNGATNTVFVANVDADADHGECVFPAITSAVFFFSAYQDIEDNVNTEEFTFDLPFEVFPNPASDQLIVNDLPTESMMQLVDMSGRTIFKQNLWAGDQTVDLTSVNSGMYILQFYGKEQIWQEKLLIEK